MGACKKRSANAPSAKRAAAPAARLPAIGDVKNAWLRAVQEEDASAAGECSRLCETLRGAELFADSDGLDAFVAIGMGQSPTGGKGGLMVALAQALMIDMSEFKVAIFETLAVAARWPSLKGRIAGSGVLGVISATLLAPRHAPPVKALMVRLCALLGVDSHDTVLLGDAKRAEEFVKIRAQFISSGVLKTIVELAKLGASDVCVASASASAVAAFASVENDAEIIQALSDAGAIPALLSNLPGGDAQLPQTQVVGDQSAVDAPEATADASASTPLLETEDHASGSASAAARQTGDEGSDDEGSDVSALPAVTAALAVVAAAEGEAVDVLRAPLYEEKTLERLRSLLEAGPGDCRRGAQEGALRCLAALGNNSNKWPIVDASLAEDLVRILTLGGATGLASAVGEFLEALLGDKTRASSLGDLRRLRRASSSLPQGQRASATKALQGTPACCQCGCASTQALLACGRCKQVEYCSRDCQKAAWADHKAVCGGDGGKKGK